MKKISVFRPQLMTTFLAFILAALLIGCENSGKSKKSTDTTTTVDTATTTASDLSDESIKSSDSTAFIFDSSAVTKEDFRIRRLYVLRMTASQFKNILKEKRANKMIKFEFERRGDGWSMFAYATDEHGGRTEPLSFHLQIATKDHGIDFLQTDREYKELVSRGQIKEWLRLPTGTEEAIENRHFTEDVWLTPCRRASDGKIIFVIGSEGTIAGCPKSRDLGEGDLNPSPPDNPCQDFGCDNPTLAIHKKNKNK